MTDPKEQFEKETKAICRGFLKAVYTGFSDNYFSFYPDLEFLEKLSIEDLQYLNTDTFPKKEYCEKKNHIYWFLSQQIYELRYKIQTYGLLSEYIRRMMRNDAKYYADLALDETDISNIDERYHREREDLIRLFTPICKGSTK